MNRPALNHFLFPKPRWVKGRLSRDWTDGYALWIVLGVSTMKGTRVKTRHRHRKNPSQTKTMLIPPRKVAAGMGRKPGRPSTQRTRKAQRKRDKSPITKCYDGCDVTRYGSLDRSVVCASPERVDLTYHDHIYYYNVHDISQLHSITPSLVLNRQQDHRPHRSLRTRKSTIPPGPKNPTRPL